MTNTFQDDSVPLELQPHKIRGMQGQTKLASEPRALSGQVQPLSQVTVKNFVCNQKHME